MSRNAFDVSDIELDDARHLRIDTSDIPKLTTKQLAEMKPLYNADERAILQNNPTDEQRSELLRGALRRVRKEHGLKLLQEEFKFDILPVFGLSAKDFKQ